MSSVRLLFLVGLTSLFIVSAHAQRGIPISGWVNEDVLLITDPVLLQLAQSVDSSQIIATLQRLEAFRTRHSSTDSVTAAKNWLVGKFQSYGYSDILQHSFTWSGRTLHNVVVTKTGVRFPNKFVLLIGHYDSISELSTTLAPGVNDNGSGIALMLEVARILATKRFDYSIRFVCFSAEEQGLIGSQAYVQNVVVPQNHDIKLIINVDQIGGFRGNANTTVKVERDEDNSPSGNNAASAAYTDTLAALTRTYSTLNTSITNAYGSDYMSFENAGYVITGYYEAIQTPHYHKSTDNFANVDPPYLYQITRGAIAGMGYFAGIQRKFLTVLHLPKGDTQDSSQAISLDARVITSSTIASASVMFRTNWNPIWASSMMTQIGSIGDTILYRGAIPRQSYGTTISYFLRLTSNDSLLTTVPTDTTVPFVFRVAQDSIPPAIVYSPFGNRSYLDDPYEVIATITDQNGVSSAWIEYRSNSGTLRTATMQQVTGDMWRGYVTGPFTAGDRVEYVVKARDGSFSNNVSTSPLSGWHLFRILNSQVFDFELTNGGFAGTGDWQWGSIGTADIPAPPRGQKVWATSLDGNYSNNMTSVLETPAIDLSNKVQIVFTFKNLYRIEPNNDGGNVRVSVDNGPYQLLTPVGGYPNSSIAVLGGPGYSGSLPNWRDASFDIATLANRTVRFRFVFASDFLTTQRGWYVDEVRLDYLDSTLVAVPHTNSGIPMRTELMQNYPNPFNPTTDFQFTVGNLQLVVFKIYDILGREVTSLVNETLSPGKYQIRWDASEFPSGVYLARLQAGEYRETQKIILMK